MSLAAGWTGGGGKAKSAGSRAAVETHDRQHAAARDSAFVSWQRAGYLRQGRAYESDRQHQGPDGLAHSEKGLPGRAHPAGRHDRRSYQREYGNLVCGYRPRAWSSSDYFYARLDEPGTRRVN